MKQGLSLLLSLGSYILGQGLFSQAATAQVTPDGTTNTTVDVSGNDFTINQGNRTGRNLFHSFGEFSVPTDGSAFFNNAADIVNIFSRVTSGNISNIDGLLRANGSANLFLLNPAGIIFGEGARLDIGGSFLGSTADSIVFPDGEFSATDLANPPLITINAPIGLSFRDNPGDIVNRSVADDVGLQVPSGKIFTLVGGNINLEDGRLTAPGGRIELGGLAEAGIVELNEDLSLNFSGELTRADVSLTGGAEIDVTSGGGGDISIFANNINVLDGSDICAGIGADGSCGSRATDFGSPDAIAGDIKLNAQETISIVGQISEVNNKVNENAFGQAGNTNIEANNLIVRDGGVIVNSVFGSGTVGDLNIRAFESVELSGETPQTSPGGLLAQIERGAEGFGGNIIIETKSLSISNGSKIQVATFGNGDAGDLIINASEINVFDTADANNFFFTGIFAGILQDFRSETLPRGSGGQITIDTEILNVLDGARISASTFGEGDGGNIFIRAGDTVAVFGINKFGNNSFIRSEVSPSGSDTPVNPEAIAGMGGDIIIETKKLIVRDGGIISTSTFGLGDAGNLTINASDSIVLSREGSGLFAEADPEAQGQGGSINVQTQSISVSDRAQVSASSAFGEGGNITLNVDDRLTLRNNSLISAKAEENANGGNIDINTEFIVAFPNQNNDIIASAERGDGGKINITAEALFGIEERPLNDITNDINASSEFGLDGTISIFTPDINTLQTDRQLPNNPIESKTLGANACSRGEVTEDSSFTLKGKGGIPRQPIEPFDSDLILVDEPITTSNLQGQSPEIKPIKTSIGDIYPARGIIKTENGKIILTSYPTDNINTRTPYNSANCTPS